MLMACGLLIYRRLYIRNHIKTCLSTRHMCFLSFNILHVITCVTALTCVTICANICSDICGHMQHMVGQLLGTCSWTCQHVVPVADKIMRQHISHKLRQLSESINLLKNIGDERMQLNHISTQLLLHHSTSRSGQLHRLWPLRACACSWPGEPL